MNISIDAENASDNIQQCFIIKNSLKSWIAALYVKMINQIRQAQASIMLNGRNERILATSGTRQGHPLLPLIIDIILNILAKVHR